MEPSTSKGTTRPHMDGTPPTFTNGIRQLFSESAPNRPTRRMAYN
jgi:hypothetical protein